MSSVQHFREFINDRLTAAAEEIFGVFAETVVRYEEEIDRQRKLLDIVLKPEIKLHRTDVPWQNVCKEVEVVSDQQLSDQERNSSLDQEEPEPPQIKEEEEELRTNQEEGQLELKQETETVMVTPADEQRDHCEPGPNSGLTHNSLVAKSRDQRGSRREESGSTRNAESQCDTDADKTSLKGDVFGKVCKCQSKIRKHYRKHTSEKPYSCKICRMNFSYNADLKVHMRRHTGEKPYSCETCGKRFIITSELNRHMRTHTGEKPYLCNTCGKRFSYKSTLTNHMRTHTGEKPFSCNICGKIFSQSIQLILHMRSHTGEKPYLCNTCGKRFSQNSNLKTHMKSHTGEKPYVCNTCDRGFILRAHLKTHMRTHTGEKPQS
ncbi:zinc finger protein 501-like [Embiotoca jacksoni]|uniref:zinc finger protein 501-like n=1 Tax=Embiotoca jacksoni TaxID=100190 RepID=UPI003704A8E6